MPETQISITFTDWVLRLFDSQSDSITLNALYKYVYQLELKLMSQIEDLQAQIDGLVADAAAEKAEVGAKIQTLLDKVTELETAIADGEDDLTAAIDAVADARVEVQNIFTPDPVVETPVDPAPPVTPV